MFKKAVRLFTFFTTPPLFLEWLAKKNVDSQAQKWVTPLYWISFVVGGGYALLWFSGYTQSIIANLGLSGFILSLLSLYLAFMAFWSLSYFVALAIWFPGREIAVSIKRMLTA